MNYLIIFTKERENEHNKGEEKNISLSLPDTINKSANNIDGNTNGNSY